MKKCFKCGESKQLSYFYKHSRMADGYLGKCKDCTKTDVKTHREDNIEKIRAYDRGRSNLPHRVLSRIEYSLTERGMEAARRGSKAYVKRNPKKYKAQTAVGNAIRDKKLFKEPCEVCGLKNVHAHHDDYAEPLDVRWLCIKHHNEWHAENGPGLNG